MYKKDFPMTKKYTMFDSASLGLKPIVMIEAVTNFYMNDSNNPHSFDSELATKTLNKMKETRGLIAKLTNSDSSEVIFTSGTSHASNMIISSIVNTMKAGDEVIVFMDAHASCVIPFLAAKKNKGIKINFVFEDKDIKNALKPNTKSLLFAQINNTTGAMHNAKFIYETVKNIAPDCIVINDVAQAIVHDVVDFQYSDAMFFSGMKLYGPTGTGALILDKKLINVLEPQEYGGGANKKFTTKGWEPLKNRWKWEIGTQNIAGIIGLGASIKYMMNIGMESIVKEEHELSEYLYEELNVINKINIFSKKGSPVILFYIDRTDSHEIAQMLAKKNVLVRAGSHCAGIMHEILGYQGATLRASLGMYNDKGDVDILVKELKNILTKI